LARACSGRSFPDLQAQIFPEDIIPIIGVVANLGLIFYMFLVGMELDLSQLKGRIAQAAVISNASVAIPVDSRDGGCRCRSTGS